MDIVCLICNMEEETVDHLFFKCELERTMWFGSQLTIRSKKANIENLCFWINQWLNQSNCVSTAYLSIVTIVSVLWYLKGMEHGCF